MIYYSVATGVRKSIHISKPMQGLFVPEHWQNAWVYTREINDGELAMSGSDQFHEFLQRILCVNGHGRTAGIDMDLGGAVLDGEVGDVPRKYNVCCAGDILDDDEILHNVFSGSAIAARVLFEVNEGCKIPKLGVYLSHLHFNGACTGPGSSLQPGLRAN